MTIVLDAEQCFGPSVLLGTRLGINIYAYEYLGRLASSPGHGWQYVVYILDKVLFEALSTEALNRPPSPSPQAGAVDSLCRVERTMPQKLQVA